MLNLTCSCMAGYRLKDGKSCEPEEDFKACSPTCPDDQICVKGKCQCKAGFVEKQGSRHLSCTKVKVCGDGANEDEIRAFCGSFEKFAESNQCNAKDNKVTCKCPTEYHHQDIETGIISKPFGCVHTPSEDRCKAVANQEMKKGMKCRHWRTENGIMTNMSCPASQEYDEAKESCQDRCEIMRNILSCVKDNRICLNNPLEGTFDCVCPPGFIDSGNQGCQLPTSVVDTTALDIKMPVERKMEIDGQNDAEDKSDEGSEGETIRLTKSTVGNTDKRFDSKFCEDDVDPEGCAQKIEAGIRFLSSDESVIKFIEREQLREKVSTGFNTIFNILLDNYWETSVIDFGAKDDKTGIFSGVKLAFLLDSRNASSFCQSDEIIDKLRQECNKHSTVHNQFCVLPGGIAFKKASLEEAKSQEINPCDSKVFKYCPPESTCSLVRSVSEQLPGKITGFPFQCTCKAGYSIDMVHFMPIQSDPKNNILDVPRREVCVDVDECLLPAGHKWRTKPPCPSDASCIDLPGGFQCKCLKGSKYNSSENSCQDVCGGITCEHGGVCQVHSQFDDHYECKCADGFRGDFCELEDEKVKGWRSTMIGVTSALSVLLLLAIVGIVITHKR
jgi:hypothetical protein